MRILAVDDFGAVARQRRLDLGLSQAELARRADVTRQWLVRFEQGNSEVAISKAFAVLRELGLTVRADPSEVRSPELDVPLRKVKYRIPKIETPQIDLDELKRNMTRVRTTDSQGLLSEVRERIKRLDAANPKSERGLG